MAYRGSCTWCVGVPEVKCWYGAHCAQNQHNRGQQLESLGPVDRHI